MCTDMKEFNKPKICPKLSQSMISTAASVINNATPQKPTRKRFSAQSSMVVHTFLMTSQSSRI